MNRIFRLAVLPVTALSLLLAAPPSGPNTECIIAGRVLNELTGEPLENANAFLAGTTIGTSSGPRGEFVLRSILTGGQDLVISLVGYERRVVRVQLKAGDSTFVTMALIPQVLQAEQVQVEASEPKEWKRNLALFEKVLRGEGEFADQVRLLNPYVVDLKMRGTTLVGTTDSLLRIENPGLGYMMGVVIRRFEWDVRHDGGVWAVYVHFREIPGQSEQQHEEWLKHRRAAYDGSLRHFLWALARSRLSEQGFEMRTGKNISYSRGWKGINEDSLHLDRVPGTPLLTWTFPEWIRVDPGFSFSSPSYVHLVHEHALFDSSGVLVTPLALELGGTWARERIGNMLPTDYFPEPIP
jgi:hypothetical protein